MLLAIDLGNTRLKWALFEGHGGETRTGSLQLARLADDDLWCEFERLPTPDRVGIACVAGSHWSERLSGWIRGKWDDCPVVEITGDLAYRGLTNGYRIPAQLGADRWAAIVAARASTSGPFIVADVGSACTVDAVDGNGVHRGGLIVPGLHLMRQSLISGTRGVRFREAGEVQGWGSDTAACVGSGTRQALAGLIRAAREQIEEEERCAVECILTGGDGQAIGRLLGGRCRYEDSLVLKGIALLARKGGEA